MAAKSVCTIPGCGKSVVARGWCSAHYARWRNHGSPEGGLHRPDVERYYQEIVLRHEGPSACFGLMRVIPKATALCMLGMV